MKIKLAANIAVIDTNDSGEQSIICLFSDYADAAYLCEMLMEQPDSTGHSYTIQCITDNDLPQTLKVTGPVIMTFNRGE